MYLQGVNNMKKYACENFHQISAPCTFSVTGEEDTVIQEAVDHAMEEHGFMDSPQLREDIKACLIDVPPGG